MSQAKKEEEGDHCSYELKTLPCDHLCKQPLELSPSEAVRVVSRTSLLASPKEVETAVELLW